MWRDGCLRAARWLQELRRGWLSGQPHDTGSGHCPSLVVPSHAGERGWVGSASPASELFVSGARAEERGLKTQPGTGASASVDTSAPLSGQLGENGRELEEGKPVLEPRS